MKQPIALVVAHPGHEMRVHAWLEMESPLTFVLTDGSGHTRLGRLSSTEQILNRAGARPGKIFGRYNDREAYQLITEGQVETVQNLIDELAEELIGAEIETVVSDAMEGFNPVHDLCSLVAQAAVSRIRSRSGKPIRHYDFLLEAAPDAWTPGIDGSPVRIELDDATWDRKEEAAWAYGLLRSEVERAMAVHGPGAFRLEVLRPVHADRNIEELIEAPPTYETVGEARVASGIYSEVLTFQEHFLPLARTILDNPHRG